MVDLEIRVNWTFGRTRNTRRNGQWRFDLRINWIKIVIFRIKGRTRRKGRQMWTRVWRWSLRMACGRREWTLFGMTGRAVWGRGRGGGGGLTKERLSRCAIARSSTGSRRTERSNRRTVPRWGLREQRSINNRSSQRAFHDCRGGMSLLILITMRWMCSGCSWTCYWNWKTQSIICPLPRNGRQGAKR